MHCEETPLDFRFFCALVHSFRIPLSGYLHPHGVEIIRLVDCEAGANRQDTAGAAAARIPAAAHSAEGSRGANGRQPAVEAPIDNLPDA